MDRTFLKKTTGAGTMQIYIRAQKGLSFARIKIDSLDLRKTIVYHRTFILIV